MTRFVAACVLLLLASGAPAVVDIYEFSDPSYEARYQRLIAELRCPKCQNQNLAGSDAPVAADLRAEIRALLEQGQSDQQIKTFLTDRYGNFVLYKPKLSGSTLLVWLLPGVVFFVALAIVWQVVQHARRGYQEEQLRSPDSGLSADRGEPK